MAAVNALNRTACWAALVAAVVTFSTPISCWASAAAQDGGGPPEFTRAHVGTGMPGTVQIAVEYTSMNGSADRLASSIASLQIRMLSTDGTVLADLVADPSLEALAGEVDGVPAPVRLFAGKDGFLVEWQADPPPLPPEPPRIAVSMTLRDGSGAATVVEAAVTGDRTIADLRHMPGRVFNQFRFEPTTGWETLPNPKDGNHPFLVRSVTLGVERGGFTPIAILLAKPIGGDALATLSTIRTLDIRVRSAALGEILIAEARQTGSTSSLRGHTQGQPVGVVIRGGPDGIIVEWATDSSAIGGSEVAVDVVARTADNEEATSSVPASLIYGPAAIDPGAPSLGTYVFDRERGWGRSPLVPEIHDDPAAARRRFGWLVVALMAMWGVAVILQRRRPNRHAASL